jgi:hypothetical protein
LSQESKATQFPTVFLTLVSIVVALGIENLLGHVGAQFGDAPPDIKPLIVAQAVTIFLVVGAIWISYASMLMTTRWDPRFEDFYAPLAILALLYFAIQAIGTNQTAWFFLTSFGWCNAGLGIWFRDPAAEESRMHREPDGWRAIVCVLGLGVLAFVSGVASLLGAMGSTAAAVVVSLMAAAQLLGAWFHFRWLRAA